MANTVGIQRANTVGSEWQLLGLKVKRANTVGTGQRVVQDQHRANAVSREWQLLGLKLKGANTVGNEQSKSNTERTQ
eukprot:1162087-Pelagomonas_calceolata.AAC.12